MRVSRKAWEADQLPQCFGDTISAGIPSTCTTWRDKHQVMTGEWAECFPRLYPKRRERNALIMGNATLETTCCIVGGGPAGIMLGYLLARMGVAVTVLEKHQDFFRDFRGDTVHPSTLEVMYELGLSQDFLRVPHQELTRVGGVFGTYAFTVADFRNVATHCKFVALMPQWDFLDFLSSRARKFSNFDLRMQHEAVGLVRDGGRIVGVEVQTPNGPAEIRSDLVVGCDGRHSVIRKASQLELIEFGVPIDVLWFHIKPSRKRSRATAGQFQLWTGARPDQSQRVLSGGTADSEGLV